MAHMAHARIIPVYIMLVHLKLQYVHCVYRNYRLTSYMIIV